MNQRTWIFPERHPTIDGPWSDEPDKAQWIDESTGLDCLIVRQPRGFLCGYVGVPPEHPWHGKDYDDEGPVEISVHGGLTFADRCQEGAEDGPGICHVPEPGRPTNVWWFGFDCAHAWDLSPSDVQRAQAEPYYPWAPADGIYRDFGYVQHEITELAAQLAEVGGSHG